MNRTFRLTALLAAAIVLAGCSKIGNALNRKDPVNTLRPTMSVGGSTDSERNPLLIPPGMTKQAKAK